MSDSSWRALVVVLILEGSLVLPSTLPAALAAGSPQASLDYAVTRRAYANAVRVADPYTMAYPRILVDRHAGSPYFGTVYVVGTGRFDWTTYCIQPVVSRSSDGGATFSPPEPAQFCLPGTFTGTAGGLYAIGDAAVGWDGSLFLASGWQGILRSGDQGRTWILVGAWYPRVFILGLSVDPEDGDLYAVGTPYAFANQTQSLQVARTTDGGSLWSTPVRLPFASQYFDEATIAAQSGSVAVSALTHSNATGRPSISVVVVSSQDRGITWGDSRVLATGADYPLTPQVRASPQGVFGVSWEQVVPIPAGNDTYVMQAGIAVSRSFDHGRNFSAPETISNNASWLIGSHGVPIVFDNESRMYVTWESTVQNGTETKSFLYTAISAPGLTGGPFATGLENFDVNVTEMEDIAMGLNDTAYLEWFDINYDTNYTIDNATSGVYVRTVTGLGIGNLTDPSHLLDGAPMLELRASGGRVAARVAWSGSPIVLAELVPDSYVVTLTGSMGSVPAGTMPVRMWSETTFTVRVQIAQGPDRPFPLLGVAAVAAVLAVLGAALTALHYTRLNRENVFQRKVRLVIYEYIRAHPGSSLSNIRSTFGLHNGVAAYHLDVLERQGFLHSEARRGHRWYFASGDVSLWKDLPLSPLQSAILRATQERPGIGVRELSRQLERRVSSVADCIKTLEREGVLRAERWGRRLCCFPADAGENL